MSIKLSQQHYTYIGRAVAISITLAVTLGASYIPEKRLSLAPGDDVYQSLFDDRSDGGLSDIEWLNEGASEWACKLRQSDAYPSCGYALSFNKPVGEGLDFSKYHGFVLHLEYEGDAERIRIFMRNHNPRYATNVEPDTAKFMSLFLRRQDLNKQLLVSFNEFNVADWWLTDFNVPRPYTVPEFDNIVSFGLDMVNIGDHRIKIKELYLVGERVPKETLYLSIILVWMVLLLTEVAIRITRLALKSRASDRQLSELRNDYDLLHEEKVEFERKSTTDHLTRVQNRTGIHQQLTIILENTDDRSSIGVILFDIDHFKRINDRRGHDAGDRVLKEIANVFRENTRDSDLLGRWGGEEFILICPKVNESNLKDLGEKLRTTISKHGFEENDPITVTISVGITRFKHLESFEQAFKRADDALYHAKNSGRNCCVYKANI